jgi:hypothetical protein
MSDNEPSLSGFYPFQTPSTRTEGSLHANDPKTQPKFLKLMRKTIVNNLCVSSSCFRSLLGNDGSSATIRKSAVGSKDFRKIKNFPQILQFKTFINFAKH